MIFVKLHVDTVGYQEKPSKDTFRTIKPRLQNDSTVQIINLEDLIDKIENGYSISPGVLSGGMTANDWKEQTVFMVDIDNADEDDTIMTPDKAFKICNKHYILPVFYYYTFSNTKDKPKFRLVFVMEKKITDEKEREKIMIALTSMFSQADMSCQNADRVFLGTNTKVHIYDLDNKVPMTNIGLAYADSFKKNLYSKKKKTTVPTI